MSIDPEATNSVPASKDIATNTAESTGNFLQSLTDRLSEVELAKRPMSLDSDRQETLCEMLNSISIIFKELAGNNESVRDETRKYDDLRTKFMQGYRAGSKRILDKHKHELDLAVPDPLRDSREEEEGKGKDSTVPGPSRDNRLEKEKGKEKESLLRQKEIEEVRATLAVKAIVPTQSILTERKIDSLNKLFTEVNDRVNKLDGKVAAFSAYVDEVGDNVGAKCWGAFIFLLNRYLSDILSQQAASDALDIVSAISAVCHSMVRFAYVFHSECTSVVCHRLPALQRKQ